MKTCSKIGWICGGVLAACLVCVLLLFGCDKPESDATTPMSKPAASAGEEPDLNKYVGTWDMKSLELKSKNSGVNEADVNLLREMGLEVYLNLNEDMTVEFVMFDFAFTGTWKAASNTSATLIIDNETADLTLSAGKLTLELKDDKITFEKGKEKHPDESMFVENVSDISLSTLMQGGVSEGGLLSTWDVVSITDKSAGENSDEEVTYPLSDRRLFLDLSGNGKANFFIFDENWKGSWEAVAVTAGTVTFGTVRADVTLDGDKLRLEGKDYTVEFKRGAARTLPTDVTSVNPSSNPSGDEKTINDALTALIAPDE